MSRSQIGPCLRCYSSHDLLLSKGLHVCSSSHFNARHVFMHLTPRICIVFASLITKRNAQPSLSPPTSLFGQPGWGSGFQLPLRSIHGFNSAANSARRTVSQYFSGSFSHYRHPLTGIPPQPPARATLHMMGETSLIVGTSFLQVDNASPKRPLRCSLADVAGFFYDVLLDDTLEKLHTACWVTAVLMKILSSELENRDNR